MMVRCDSDYPLKKKTGPFDYSVSPRRSLARRGLCKSPFWTGNGQHYHGIEELFQLAPAFGTPTKDFPFPLRNSRLMFRP